MPHPCSTSSPARVAALCPARVTVLLFAATLLAMAGCGDQTVHFEPNLVYMRRQAVAEELDDFQTEPVKTRVRDVQRVMTRLFGTPDEPRLPEIDGLDIGSMLDLEMLVIMGSGRERRKPEFRSLFQRAGLKLQRSFRLADSAHCMEAVRRG